MWVGQTGLTEIDTKLRDGATAEVDRLLREVIADPAVPSTVPVSCPTCRRDLVRQPLAIAGLFGSACPDGHGAWLSPDVADSLRALVGTRATATRRHRMVLAGGVAVLPLVVLAVLTLSSGRSTRPSLMAGPEPARPHETTRTEKTVTATAPEAVDRVDPARLGEDYWPERRWPGARPIPLKCSRIDVHAEIVYFDELLELLEIGITNRLNMESGLALNRPPDRYGALYEVYRQRQEDVLGRLRALAVPGRLQPVHEPIVQATERQIAFYGDYARTKAQDPKTTLRSLLTHPALREQNQRLLEAWGRVGQLYPDLDQPTHQAIYYHLCGFDSI